MKTIPALRNPADFFELIPAPETSDYSFFDESPARPMEPSSAFSHVNAWTLSEFSFLAYAKDKAYIGTQMARAGFADFRCFGFESEGSPHIVVARREGVIVVAFRGTSVTMLADIVADIELLPTPTPDGGIHSGFQMALTGHGEWDKAKTYIQATPGQQVIFFTGHSLGAALATLAARGYSDPSRRERVLYTFGSPRVGDHQYAFTYPCPAYRVVNNQDIVTHVPTPPFYEHTGTAYTAKGIRIAESQWDVLEDAAAGVHLALGVSNHDARMLRLSEYLSGIVAGKLKPISDHAPQNYAARLFNSL